MVLTPNGMTRCDGLVQLASYEIVIGAWLIAMTVFRDGLEM